MSQRLASIGIGLSAIVVAGFLFASPAPAYAACVIETAQDVWLYSKDNCEGSTKSLVESTKSISNFNDKATSLKIQGDISAFFYERDEFGGKSICWNGRQPINRLDDYKITPTNGWAFDISSVEIKQAGACTNEGQTIAPIDGDDCGGGIGGVVCNAKKFVSGIRNAYIGIPFLIILVPLWVVALLSETLVAALGGALIWIAQRAIEIPVIPQAGNEFVQQGLAFSQGIVQGLFAFILVFIGFATILRLQTYQLQRTLPLLIIVALLINFSPVLVGFVVDMGNILTNFFLSAQQVQSWKAIPQTAGDMGNDIIEFVTTPGFGNALAKLVEIAVRNIVIVLFNTALLLVLFVVLLLFIVRTAVLWVLAILAPFAFAAYILPGTRRYWTQWWGQLIQWSLIGVPIGFSLYLASMSASYADKVLPVGGNLQGVSALIASIVGPFTTIIILGAGVAISMQLAPAASRGAINFGKKWGTAGAGFAGRKAWQYARDRVPHETRETMRKASASANPEWGKSMGGLGGRIFRGAAGAYGYSKRTAGRGFTTVVGGSEQADIEKMRAAAAKRDAVGNLSAVMQAGSITEQTAIMDAARQKNQIKDMLDPNIVGKGNELKPDLLANIYKRAHQMRNDDLIDGVNRAVAGEEWKDENGNSVDATDKRGNKIRVAETDEESGEIKKDASGNVIYQTDASGNPVYRKRMLYDRFAQITDDMTKNAFKVGDRTGLLAGTYVGGDGKTVVIKTDRASGLAEDDIKNRGYGSFADKIIGEAKTADEIKALQKGWWNNKDLMDAAHKFWAGNQTSQAATAFGRDFISKLEATKKSADWYLKIEERIDDAGTVVSRAPRNVAMVRYLASSAAQGLGISPLQGLERSEDVTRMSNVANILARQSRLEAPYIRLRGVMEETHNLERERRRGAPQADIDALKAKIDSLKADIQRDIEALARGLGGADANKLEADWDRIEQLMQTRRGRRP